MAYERELTGLKGAAGLAGATGRSLLNIVQRSDLEKILGRSLEQEEFAEEGYEQIGRQETRMGDYRTKAGGIGAIIGWILGKGDPRAAKWGYDAGAYVGERAGQAGKATLDWSEIAPGGKPFVKWSGEKTPQMPESLGEVPVRFHKSKAAILGKQRTDFNKFMNRHQVDLTTQRGRNTMNRFLDTMQFMVASNPQSSDMLKNWMKTGEGWWGEPGPSGGKFTDIFGFESMFDKASQKPSTPIDYGSWIGPSGPA